MGAARPLLPRNIRIVLEEDMETPDQHNPRLIGSERFKDDESWIEYFKSLAPKAIKQAAHRMRKDVVDTQLPVNEKVIIRHNRALRLPTAVLKLMSDGFPAFLGETDK
jgi:hypothetical protein